MSNKISDCLKNLIGITPKYCGCDPKPDNWDQINDSWSGQYIENTELGIPLKLSGKPCGPESIWEKLEQIRCEAIEDFLTRYILELGKRQLKSFKGYSDCFGQPKNNSTLGHCDGKILGFCINPRTLYKGASLCLTEGSLCTNAPNGTEFEIQIIKLDDPLNPVATLTATTGANGIALIQGVPQELPLSNNGKPIKYAIVYDRGDYKPKDIKFSCGCSGTSKPGYMVHDYFQTQGIQSGSLESLRYNYSVNSYTHGLLIDFTIKCDALGWMCTRDQDWWCTSEFGRLAALAIVGIANMKMISYCLSQPTSYTILNAEQMYGKFKWIEKRVQGLMTHISARSVDDITHCFQCNPALGYKIQSHIV